MIWLFWPRPAIYRPRWPACSSYGTTRKRPLLFMFHPLAAPLAAHRWAAP